MDPIISVRNLRHVYNPDTPERAVTALDGVSLDVMPGEYLVILGHNGCGKSTLAKHLNALLLPTDGDVLINGLNTKDKTRLRDIRSTIGMVFQIPDNQMVATIVDEDVAFGPENLGVPHAEMTRRVDWTLDRVGMLAHRHRAPHLLSGGQKQRVCIAGVLAMHTRVLVLDEATAMLDPLGRREVLDVVRRLNKEEGATIVAITHHMEEAVGADRVIVMDSGRIALQGTPREIFAQLDALRALHMDVPQAVLAANVLGVSDALTVDAVVDAYKAAGRALTLRPPAAAHTGTGEPIITVRNLEHYYMRDTPLEVKAVHDISFDVRKGEILGIIGHTGSGKSTAAQHLNALYRPHGGEVRIFGLDPSKPDLDAKAIRRRVGLVFQSPEDQLFEQYVGDDIAYGPRNLKLPKEEVRERVRLAMEAVGLGFEEYKDRITFSLSGGQMRRAAIAGVLALQPEVLALDEPTAGLDPQGRIQLWATLLKLRDEGGLTLVVISHNMEDLARVCDRVCVISEGRTVMVDTPRAVFSRVAELRALGLDIPPVTEIGHRIGLGTVLSVEELTRHE